MCNSEFSESLSNALFSQLKDVFTLYFFDFLFNIKPSTLVLADKTRRLFEVLSLFLLLSLLFCLLGPRHNKLLDLPLIHSLWRSEAGMFPRLRGLPCRNSSCYGVAKLMSTCWAGSLAKFTSFRTSLLVTLLCHLILSRRLRQRFNM